MVGGDHHTRRVGPRGHQRLALAGQCTGPRREVYGNQLRPIQRINDSAGPLDAVRRALRSLDLDIKEIGTRVESERETSILVTLPITTGVVPHERGGLEKDVSAGDGFVEIKSGATTIIKSNLAATVAPAASDDSGLGYQIGSRWIDTSADAEYICLDATAAAAVWAETTVTLVTAITDRTTLLDFGIREVAFS